MRKSLQELRYLEEKRLYKELKKIDNAEKYYKNHSFFNSMAIMFFIMGFILIITACIYQTMLLKTNEILVSLFIIMFILLSLVSLIISTFYNFKTINLVKQYYNSQI